jgi:DNA-binding transcriptional MocR family regulator
MDPVNWQKHLARSAQGMSSSAIRDLLKLTEQSEVISLAGGLPAPEFFPSEEIAAACEQALVERPWRRCSMVRPRAMRRCASLLPSGFPGSV